MLLKNSENAVDASTRLEDTADTFKSSETISGAFKLSETIVDTLLAKLGGDDAFRDLFQKNAREALASLGHQASMKATDSDEGIWMCCTTTALASKEVIRASHNELRKQLLTSQAALHPITLQA